MMITDFSPSPVTKETPGAGQKNTPVQALGTVDSQPVEPRSVNTRPVKETTATTTPPPEPPDLKEIVEASTKFMQRHQQHLSFAVDEASGRMVVSVIDSNTAELIRQIPSEELLTVSRKMRQLLEENTTSNGALLVEKSA